MDKENSLGCRRPAAVRYIRVRQRAGKIVQGYAMEGDLDASAVRSNDVAIEWPPRSGRTVHFPEIDRAAYFASLAREKIVSQPTAISRSSGKCGKLASRQPGQKASP